MNSTLLKGSGPVSGVIEISNRIKSTKAFNNYFPSKKVRIFTKENSGHYWQNWNDSIRNQFIEFMRSKKIEIAHFPGQ